MHTIQNTCLALANAIAKETDKDKDNLVVQHISKFNKEDMKDATVKFLVSDKQNDKIGFVLLSSDDFVDTADLTAQAAQKAAQILGDPLANLIVLATHVGKIGKNSYAYFPYLVPFNQGRLSRLIVRQHIVGKVCDWLEKVAHKTMRAIPDEKIEDGALEPLRWVQECDIVPDGIKAEANGALNALEAGQWAPYWVFSHNDLWFGNVMAQPMAGAAMAAVGFGEPRIIDWLGSSQEGIPGFDLLNYAYSTGYPFVKIANYFQTLNNSFNRDASTTYFDLLAGFGRLGMNRGEFPLKRYGELLQITTNNYKQVKTALRG